jgi:hypothetical protein
MPAARSSCSSFAPVRLATWTSRPIPMPHDDHDFVLRTVQQALLGFADGYALGNSSPYLGATG